MTTNVWLTQQWVDHNFVWNPSDFGGVKTLHIPSDKIWLPDIVLYNNADGNYQVTIMTRATVSYNGTVIWEPPAIYRSMCQIDVEWFPFDQQECLMRFGSWTYDGLEVDLVHGIDVGGGGSGVGGGIDYMGGGGPETARGPTTKTTRSTAAVNDTLEKGIDLRDFYPSVEWDIMRVPAERHEERYNCCVAPYIDITFTLELRRKTLFYTVNLIIPSVGISLLTVTVFFLPSDSGEKVVLCISILISLTVFFLLLVEIIPSTSLVIPLIGLYLLFTMVVVTGSIAVTVITLNVHYRSPNTHTLPKWARKLFLHYLPYILRMERPKSTLRKEAAKTPDGEGGKTEAVSKEMLLSVLGIVKERSSSCSAGSKVSTGDHRSGGHRGGEGEGDREAFGGGGGVDEGGGLDGGSGGMERSSYSSSHYKCYKRFPKLSDTQTAVEAVSYIADHLKKQDLEESLRGEWRYIASVLDRLFLCIFALLCLLGTSVIILRAPIIYDSRTPLK